MRNRPFRRFFFLRPLFMLAIAALLSWAVYGLWNGVAAEVLGLKAVTYWQALGLLVLGRILFGGFPGRGLGPPWRHKMMMHHWDSLSPEEREKWRDNMRSRFGDWGRPGFGPRDIRSASKPGDASSEPVAQPPPA